MRLATTLLLLVSLLGGCALLPDQIDETKDWSAQKLYSEAKSSLEEADWVQRERMPARLKLGFDEHVAASDFGSIRDARLVVMRHVHGFGPIGAGGKKEKQEWMNHLRKLKR